MFIKLFVNTNYFIYCLRNPICTLPNPMKMKTTLSVASRATSRTFRIAWKKFVEQFESPSDRNYRRLKDFLSNG
jgi:hypothetical protein